MPLKSFTLDTSHSAQDDEPYRCGYMTALLPTKRDVLWLGCVTCLLMLWVLVSGCQFSGGTKPVIKIGLIAPFDGELRHVGYQRLYGVKLALQEANLAGGVAGYKIELVALNDYASPSETTLQAQELVIDSYVRGIVGQWETPLLQVSTPIYQAADLAVVEPARFTDLSGLPPTFVTDFEAKWHVSPSIEAQQAYLATRQLLKAMEAAVGTYGSPDRSNIQHALITLTMTN